MHPVDIPYAKLRTNFEVSSSARFEYIFVCQKFYGSRDLGRGHAPFREKLFERLLSFLKTKLSTKFEVPSSSSFQDIFDRMPKN